MVLIKQMIKEGFFTAYVFQFITIFYSFFLIFIFNYSNLTYEYGQYVLLIASLDFLTSFIGFNSGESIIYFLAKKKYSIESILKIGRITDFVLGSVIVLISLLIFSFISSDYIEIAYNLAVVFSLKTLFILLRNSVNGFWQYNNLFTKFYGVMIIESFIKIIMILIISFVFLKFNLQSLIYIEILTSLAFTIIIYVLFLFDYNRISVKQVNKSEKLYFRNFFSYSSKLFMTATIKSGNKKIDYLILGLFVSPLEIGVYDKLKKIFLPINALIQPFRQIYYPKYIKKINSKLYREANSLIMKFSFYLSLIVILFVLFVFFMKQPLFDLLQIENSYEINFLFYCLPFTSIFLSMFWWVTNFSSSVNPNFSLFANLISTFCIISLSLFFLNLFGFIGIGLSLLTNIIILAIYWIIKYKNYAFN
jgi:O-antigen/teichoic acid export membrane protein